MGDGDMAVSHKMMEGHSQGQQISRQERGGKQAEGTSEGAGYGRASRAVG